MNNGNLIISLDFELIWGVFDSVTFENSQDYFDNTKAIIPEVLGMFERNRIHCTWAIVGMLFNDNWNQWKENFPSSLPDYSKPQLSSFKEGLKLASIKNSKHSCFAPELIDLIGSYESQEIGTHTYSHYYCLEDGQNLMNFRADLEKAIEIASLKGIQLKSLVFPRNQMNQDYLKICYELGITNVRSNPAEWYWKNPESNQLKVKLARTGDAYINMGKKSYPITDLKRINDLPITQPASRFLRPVEGNDFMRKLKLRRIKNEMSVAAKKKEIYHLWWHPHNFGYKPKESLHDLACLIKHYTYLNNKYNFKSLNMKELGALVK
ncbi:polysaccharide deacetylase family protein [Christiangramia salexigens]|uniref:Polysaccharide deacetylase n=1 Tax=Christiangramia salexigens TaxID=1913577 RepID=A0A1L3J2C6_9FLAO|nr:polysaccharide deacetylase family protein [Christiangramia salexigens]APG59279.1 polysaccharide deacetylase [Christiangramia salexigens]